MATKTPCSSPDGTLGLHPAPNAAPQRSAARAVFVDARMTANRGLAGHAQRQRRHDHQETARGLLRRAMLIDQRPDGRAAASAATPGATGLRHFLDRTGAVADRLADRAITDSLAVTDEHGRPPKAEPKDIESRSQNQLDSTAAPHPTPDRRNSRLISPL